MANLSKENQTAKHTPGPLIVEQSYGMLWMWNSNKQRILAMLNDGSELKDEIREMNLANFNLYAAAPELLEALQLMVKDYWADYKDSEKPQFKKDHPDHFINKAEAAITKATGGTK